MPTIELPQLHRGQARVYNHASRFTVIQCGRRWGKTVFGEVIISIPAIEGEPVSWFAPTYKYLQDVWREMTAALRPIIKKADSQEKRIELTTGGVIDFWTMDTSDPGRGRKYKRVVIDECGIVKGLLDTWQAAIRPTLTDLKGDAFFLGTPKGRREFHQLFQRGEQGQADWSCHRGKTVDNPLIDPSEVESARRDLPEHVFRQEYEGIPADDAGNPFGASAIAACVRTPDPAPVVVWGVDLAKSEDWTVAVGLSSAGGVVAFHRWQAPWSTTIARLAQIVGHTPALVDSTGVGDPIVEQLQAVCPSIEGFHFSSASKQRIMEGLAVAIQRSAVAFNEPVLQSELESFGYEYTKTGVRYSAPAGLHDDCVCALALAVSHLPNTGELRLSVVSGGLIADKEPVDVIDFDGMARMAQERFARGT